MTAPYPSGTAILLKEAGEIFEILLLRRNVKLAFHGDAWVFPGGRVDRRDYAVAGEDIADVARTAAVRETKEEAGIDISPDDLILMSQWTTPEGLPKRYTAWFFVSAIGDVSVTVDGSEIVDYQWMRPNQALDAHRSGRIELPPPTFVTLLQLSAYQNVENALSSISGQQHMVFRPRALGIKDGMCFLYEGDAGYESQDINAPGSRHRLWVREQGYEYETSGEIR